MLYITETHAVFESEQTGVVEGGTLLPLLPSVPKLSPPDAENQDRFLQKVAKDAKSPWAKRNSKLGRGSSQISLSLLPLLPSVPNLPSPGAENQDGFLQKIAKDAKFPWTKRISKLGRGSSQIFPLPFASFAPFCSKSLLSGCGEPRWIFTEGR